MMQGSGRHRSGDHRHGRAEFFTAITGLGALIVKYGNQYDTAAMFVPIFVLDGARLGLTAALRRAEEWIRRGRPLANEPEASITLLTGFSPGRRPLNRILAEDMDAASPSSSMSRRDRHRHGI